MTVTDTVSAADVILRWSQCRCCCTRAPTDPCRCVWDGAKWAFERPVHSLCDDLTAKDRKQNRDAKAAT